jgi:hypothetical protein
MNRDPEDDFAPMSDWLRSEPPPFTQEDFAAMRRGVWREIEEQKRARVAFRPGRFVFAGALCAAAAVALLWLRPSAEGPFVAPPAFDGVPAISAEAAALGRSDLGGSRTPFAAAAPSSSAPRRWRAGARPGAVPADDAPVKIEFQTANPDVRIIWLVKKDEAPPRSISAGRKEEVS